MGDAEKYDWRGRHVGVLVAAVFIMEPMSTLQKMAEILQYQHLLDKAAVEDDDCRRLALVTAYAVYAGGTFVPIHGVRPILGELRLKLNDGGSAAIYEQARRHCELSQQRTGYGEV